MGVNDLAEARALFTYPLHLGLGAKALPQPAFTGMELGPGDYAINPPSVWHTADVDDAATALFITAGDGAQHRPR